MSEVIAVASGIVAVVLATREHVATWPVGLVSVGLYVFIFYDARLYSDVILHLFYVGMQVYGWWSWLRGGAGHGHRAITHLARRPFLLWVAATLAGSALWGWIMASWTDAALPWADAFTTAASFAAQYLMARKYMQHWVFWFVINLVAMGVYVNRGLWLTAGLYGVYWVLSMVGYRSWQARMV